MDLLNLEQAVYDPSVISYKWKGSAVDDNGKEIPLSERVSYYKKHENGEGETIIVKKPFNFAPLAIAMYVGGGMEVKKGRTREYVGFWSKGVLYKSWHEAVNTKVNLYQGKDIVDTGTIKELVERNNGAKIGFTVYVWNYDTEQVERFVGVGSFATAVRSMLFSSDEYKGVTFGQNVLSLTDYRLEKIGSVRFAVPVFSVVRQLDIANKEDVVLPEQAKNIVDYLETALHYDLSKTELVTANETGSVADTLEKADTKEKSAEDDFFADIENIL